MNIKYYTLEINDKVFKNFDDKFEAIKEYRNLEVDKKELYEVVIDNNNQNKKLVSVDDEVPFNEIKWYEIRNTINEWDSQCTGRYRTLEKAKEGLKDKQDYYRPLGTGTIYEYSINNQTFSIKTKRVFEK